MTIKINLITRRSLVRIQPPLPKIIQGYKARFVAFFVYSNFYEYILFAARLKGGIARVFKCRIKAASTSIRHLEFRQNGSAFTNPPAPLAIPPCAGPTYLTWGAKPLHRSFRCPRKTPFTSRITNKLCFGMLY